MDRLDSFLDTAHLPVRDRVIEPVIGSRLRWVVTHAPNLIGSESTLLDTSPLAHAEPFAFLTAGFTGTPMLWNS